jgi:glycosyltransferase involved in cell wall biosynthesis
MKKILHVIHNLELGGVEVGLLSSFEDLNSAFDYNILVIGKVDSEMLTKLSDSLKSKIYILNTFSLTSFYRFIFSKKFDYIITSLWKAHLLGLVLKFTQSSKVFPFIHNGRYFHQLDAICTNIQVLFSTRIFVDSRSTGLFISHKFLFRKKNIIEAPFIQNINVKSKPHLSSDLLTFCSVSRIAKSKNIQQVIIFLNELNRLGYNFIYHIYGPDGGYLKELLDLIDKLGLSNKIQYKGEINFNQRAEVFIKYDLYVQFSLMEGFSKSVYESMLLGLVPVVYPAGEIANYCINEHNSIIISNFNDYNTSSIIRLFNDKTFLPFLSKNALEVNKYPTLSDVLINELS